MNSLQGRVLVASAELRDPNFFRTVVLIVRHNDEGAFGLVLNRSTNFPVQQLWEKVHSSTCRSKETLRAGGPVEGPLMALHDQPELGEIEVLPGAWFAGEPAKIAGLVALPKCSARFFIGYSGWGPDQLEAELREGSWLVSQAKPQHLFGDDHEMWQRTIKDVNDESMLATLKIPRTSADPSLN